MCYVGAKYEQWTGIWSYALDITDDIMPQNEYGGFYSYIYITLICQTFCYFVTGWLTLLIYILTLLHLWLIATHVLDLLFPASNSWSDRQWSVYYYITVLLVLGHLFYFIFQALEQQQKKNYKIDKTSCRFILVKLWATPCGVGLFG